MTVPRKTPATARKGFLSGSAPSCRVAHTHHRHTEETLELRGADLFVTHFFGRVTHSHPSCSVGSADARSALCPR